MLSDFLFAAISFALFIPFFVGTLIGSYAMLRTVGAVGFGTLRKGRPSDIYAALQRVEHSDEYAGMRRLQRFGKRLSMVEFVVFIAWIAVALLFLRG